LHNEVLRNLNTCTYVVRVMKWSMWHAWRDAKCRVHTKLLSVNLKGKDHLWIIRVDWWIILKWILKL